MKKEARIIGTPEYVRKKTHERRKENSAVLKKIEAKSKTAKVFKGRQYRAMKKIREMELGEENW